VKNVLVTGGAGFIGSHTVVELIAAGLRPVIIDNFNNSERTVIAALKQITGQDITLYKGEFQDRALLRKVLAAESIDGVIHFAAYKAVGESVANPLKYYDNNVAGFVVLLQELTTAKITNFVFSSSCAVYGNPDTLPITEDAPVKPAVSPYGYTKQVCEIMLRDTANATKGWRTLALRYFNPIGAHSSALIGELPLGTPTNLIPLVTHPGLHPCG
jgi:UDP-glucose 4-epimerase